MPDEPAQPGAEQPSTTIEAVEQLMGAGYAAMRADDQAKELQRLKRSASALATIIDTAGAVVGEATFKGSCMALANHCSSMLRCERVSVGTLHARTCIVRAVSNVETIDRASPLVTRIEEAMNECTDQDVEVLVPTTPDRPTITRMHQKMAEASHPSVLSVPMRSGGEAIGAITLERIEPFSVPEIGAVRTLAELVTPRIEQLRTTDRWFGARVASWSRRLVGNVLGERYTWSKLVALGVFGLVLFALLVEGPFRVAAPCAVEASARATIAAPYDGRVRAVFAEAGDEIDAPGTDLMRLDDTDLRLRLVAAEAEAERVRSEIAVAQRDRDLAREGEARLRLKQAESDVALLERRVGQALIEAPIAGTILAGDWSNRLGAPVQRGEVLYEIAPLDELRLDIDVDDRDIGDVVVGQRGVLATAAFPGRTIVFTVDEIVPLAQDRSERSVFVVRAILDERPDWLRPGMKGEARIRVGERRYAWLWTRRAADWLRLKLWL